MKFASELTEALIGDHWCASGNAQGGHGKNTIPIENFGFRVSYPAKPFLRYFPSTVISEIPKASVPIVMLSPGTLMATQQCVVWDKVREFVAENAQTFDPITVIQYQGEKYIWDGHHRVVAQTLLGVSPIKARLVTL